MPGWDWVWWELEVRAPGSGVAGHEEANGHVLGWVGGVVMVGVLVAKIAGELEEAGVVDGRGVDGDCRVQEEYQTEEDPFREVVGWLEFVVRGQILNCRTEEVQEWWCGNDVEGR